MAYVSAAPSLVAVRPLAVLPEYPSEKPAPRKRGRPKKPAFIATPASVAHDAVAKATRALPPAQCPAAKEQAIAAVMADEHLPPSALPVFVALLHGLDRHRGVTRAGFNVVAKRSRRNRSTVIRAIDALESRGHLTRRRERVTETMHAVAETAFPKMVLNISPLVANKYGELPATSGTAATHSLREDKKRAGDNSSAGQGASCGNVVYLQPSQPAESVPATDAPIRLVGSDLLLTGAERAKWLEAAGGDAALVEDWITQTVPYAQEAARAGRDIVAACRRQRGWLAERYRERKAARAKLPAWGPQPQKSQQSRPAQGARPGHSAVSSGVHDTQQRDPDEPRRYGKDTPEYRDYLAALLAEHERTGDPDYLKRANKLRTDGMVRVRPSALANPLATTAPVSSVVGNILANLSAARA